jgi:hypothetical protein
MMSGSSPPPDNSYAVEQARIAAAEKKDAQDKADKAQHLKDLSDLRGTTRAGASGAVKNYFSSRGIDPTAYEGSIEQQLNDMLSGISPTDENPGAAYTGAGQTIYDTLETGARSKAQGQANSTFAPDYQYTRVADTLDDPYIEGVVGEQYSDADKIIKNMLDRGVLTSTGYNSAKADLESQKPGVKSKVNEVSTGLLNKERGDLGDIANKARKTAGELTLGQNYDVTSYGKQADDSFTNFLNSFGDSLRAGITGKLFNTSGLAAIGGAGQGAGNTAYNPAAAGGTVETEDDRTDTGGTNPNSIF